MDAPDGRVEGPLSLSKLTTLGLLDRMPKPLAGVLVEDVPQCVELEERSRCQATFSL